MIENFDYDLFTVKRVLNPDEKDFTANIYFKTITTSSQEAKTGSLFVPLKGNRDGHEFIKDALDRGAEGFLCEKSFVKNIPADLQSKMIVVEDTLHALGRLAGFHRNRFTPLVIGITGSSGKTTTKEFMGLAVKQVGLKNIVVTEKNYNNEIGVPFTLFRINPFTKLVVCEMGMNHSGEISRLTQMAKPDLALVTNVGPCHIENLGSLEKIAKAKAEILEGMPKGGTIIIPALVPFISIFKEKAKKQGVKIKTFQLKNNPFLKVIGIRTDGFALEVFGEEIDWKLPGEKILENLTGVLTVVNELGLNREKAIVDLKTYKAKDKRFEIKKSYHNLIDDTYNANPDSIQSSVLSLKQIAGKNDFYVILGDMKELGKFSVKFHKEIGEFCRKENVKGVLSFGKDARYIGDSFFAKSTSDSLVSHFENTEKGIKELADFTGKHIPKGAFVLVKGSRSMKMERIVEELMNIGRKA